MGVFGKAYMRVGVCSGWSVVHVVVVCWCGWFVVVRGICE